VEDGRKKGKLAQFSGHQNTTKPGKKRKPNDGSDLSRAGVLIPLGIDKLVLWCEI
jgi:hypothetical protein